MENLQMSDSKKILIVDYDAKSLESMVQLFGPHNVDVITATDGRMAYEKFKKEKPHLILLEAMLPKLHGFDLSQKIHQETKGGVPVVIVTGLYKGSQYRNEALRSFGASDYFEKPYDEEKLVKRVMNLLHEEQNIPEDLPDQETVLRILREDEEDAQS
ncbi:MAG: PleD family two-component system response regulator [Candidatus Aminicenantales bacterium]